MAFNLTATLRILDLTSRPLRSMTSGLASAVLKVGALGGALTGIAGAAGVAALAFKSVNKAMDFEAQMSTIKALTGATNEEMAKMQTLALKMGAATKYNAMEAGQAIEELLKAGLSPATVQAGGLEAALSLATAGGLDLAEAAAIMATSLNAFKKDGLTAAQTADILAGTANASATGVHELQYSLAEVGAVAAGAGLSFEDVNVTLGLLANNAIIGQTAGTSLKSVLMNLTPASKTARNAMKDLGIITAKGANRFYDANHELRSLDEVVGVLQKSMRKLNSQQKQQYLRDMFGFDGIRAANILIDEGAKGVAKFRDEMKNVTALAVAEEKMKNAAGAVEQFSGAIETLQIAALLPTMPLIQKFASKAADMVEQYTPQITAAVQSMTDKVTKYISSHYSNNPEFQKLTTLKAKVSFIYEDLMASFNEWLKSGGSAKISAVAQKAVDLLAATLRASDPLIKAAVEVGVAVGNGIVKGIMSVKTLSALTGTSKATDKYKEWSDAYQGVVPPDQPFIDPITYGNIPNVTAPSPVTTPKTKTPEAKYTLPLPKNSGGISYVPKDGPRMIHHGEAVLHRGEAREWRNGEGSGGGVTVTGNTFNVRKESDINDVAAQLFRLLKEAGDGMGGAYA